MKNVWVFACVASLCAGLPAATRAQDQWDPDTFVAGLPEGLVKTVFERLPADQQEELGRAAQAEVEAMPADPTLPAEPRGEGIEKLIGLKFALVAAAYDKRIASDLGIDASETSDADLLTAAYSRITSRTRVGQEVQASRRLEEKLQVALLNSPFVHRPRTPCDETAHRDPLRLSGCIERKLYKSVAGLAWPGAQGLEIWCSGQLIARNLLLTADHCFDGRTDNPVVVTHFTGGTDTAIRKGDGRSVSHLTRHSVAAVRRGTTVVAANDLRGFDIAIVQLEQAVAFSGFPARATGLPDPVRMTVAGWGASDVAPVNGIGLEVTVITPEPAGRPKPVHPTLLAWPARLAAGGGICRADSGGPIFSGPPTDGGAAGMKLLGIVAGGNPDCRSGSQVITDLTRRETVEYLCRLAPESPFCPA